MDGFLDDYFPSVAANQATVNTVGNLYCQYDSQVQCCQAVPALAAAADYRLRRCTFAAWPRIHCLLGLRAETSAPSDCIPEPVVREYASILTLTKLSPLIQYLCAYHAIMGGPTLGMHVAIPKRLCHSTICVHCVQTLQLMTSVLFIAASSQEPQVQLHAMYEMCTCLPSKPSPVSTRFQCPSPFACASVHLHRFSTLLFYAYVSCVCVDALLGVLTIPSLLIWSGYTV